MENLRAEMHPPDRSRDKVTIPGVPNLRDLGGWPTVDGRRICDGLMYRSTALDRLDAAGLEAVGVLGLCTVIDLRTADERHLVPDRLPGDVRYVLCDVLGNAPNAAPAQLAKVVGDPVHAQAMLGDGKAQAMFQKGYHEIVALPSALAAYRRFFGIHRRWRAAAAPVSLHHRQGPHRLGGRRDIERGWRLARERHARLSTDQHRPSAGIAARHGPIRGSRW